MIVRKRLLAIFDELLATKWCSERAGSSEQVVEVLRTVVRAHILGAMSETICSNLGNEMINTRSRNFEEITHPLVKDKCFHLCRNVMYNHQNNASPVVRCCMKRRVAHSASWISRMIRC